MRKMLVISSLVVASIADAQPAFEKKANPDDVKDVKEVEWKVKGEAGLVASTGNARSTTMTGSVNAIRKDADNKLELGAIGAYARATTRTAIDADGNGTIEEGELGKTSATSVENVMAKARYDRYLSERNAVYVAALAGIDRPAGKDFQGGAQVGYSRSLYKDKRSELLGEVGYDLTYQRLSAGSTATIHAARLFAGYKNKLRKETELEASGEALINGNTVTYGAREASIGKATRLIGNVGVTTALSTKVSLSASFSAKYEQFPAPLAAIGGIPFAAGFEPASEKLDTLTKISLIVKFL